MSPSILLIGSTGQVGQELQRVLAPYGEAIAVGRSSLNLAQPETITQFLRTIKPEIIINAAAYTAVDRAESEPELATAVNTIAPGILAEEAKKLDAFLIHLSTDYVFDGCQSHPYRETDSPHPLNIYGRTKLAGEQAIRDNCPNHFILRTSWVYGAYGKSNFVKTMLRLGGEKEEIRVVNDQIGSPTWAKDIAKVIAQIKPGVTGTYHYSNQGAIGWYDFAKAIFEEAAEIGFPLKVQRIVPITTAEYPTPAKRPAYSVLSCEKISVSLGIHPPHWRESLKQMLKEYKTLI